MVNVTHVNNFYVRRLWMMLPLVCIVLLALSNGASAATFTATLDRNNVSVGETVTLSLRFEDVKPHGQPQLPSIAGLTVGALSAIEGIERDVNRRTSFVNYEYTLIPTKEGEITIPGMSVKVGNKTLASQPLKLTVTKQPVSSATAPDGSPAEAFLKLVLPKTEIYFGEIVPAEVRLYFQNVRDVQLPEINADGFTMKPIDQRPNQSQVQLDGRTYNLAIFKFTLSPAKTGTLKVGPAKMSLSLLSEPRRDLFGAAVFTKARQTQLVSEEVTVRVLPLPEANKPPTFAGAIGRFDMRMEAGPTTVAVGDPITVRVQIRGRGTLESLKLPDQPAWRDFRIYTPSSKVETKDPLGLEGIKTFELVVSPQNAGIKMLPPFEFSYFDPEQKAYRTLSSQDVKLQVSSSALTPQPTISALGANEQTAIEAKEIVHIKPQLGTIQSNKKPLLSSPAFWIAQAIPPGLWLAALIYRRRKENLNSNPRLRRQKQVDALVARDLQKLREQAAANNSDAFFATVFRVLQEQIGERLDVPPSAITEAVVENELKPRGLPSETLTQLHQLFQTCNQARYAPVRGSHELASYIPKVEQTISELKKLKNEPLAVAI